MGYEVIYVLNSNANLGCLPEAVLVEKDINGKFGVNFIEINKKNAKYQSYRFDKTNDVLVDICTKLEKSAILSKIAENKSKDWESFCSIYFNPQDKSVKVTAVRNYIYDYINLWVNKFFDNLSDKKIFLKQGNFPFMWSQITIEEEMPELFYCFDYAKERILYYLDITCKNEKLDIKNSILVSRKRARILKDNRIYEFDDEIEGPKLVPFFTKDTVEIKADNIDTYIQKVLLPMVLTNKVLPIGFNLEIVNNLTGVFLQVKEIGTKAQLSLFDSGDFEELSVVMELMFEYDDFVFSAGRVGKTLKMIKNDDSFTIIQALRDEKAEKYYLDLLKTNAWDLNAKFIKMPLGAGLEDIMSKNKLLQSEGIEIHFLNKNHKQENLFVGEREISIVLEEQRDWFDIKAIVRFGKFQIPFLHILNLIKKNITQFILPDGQYAQIPQQWIDEYQTLFELTKIDEGKAKVSKHYGLIAEQLAQQEKIRINARESYRQLFKKDEIQNYDFPVNFNAKLRSYQIQGYNWLRLLDECNLGGCLADDMGLGKTIQTLCLIQWLKEQGRKQHLLVVPKSLIFNWLQEFEKFTAGINVFVHQGKDRTSDLSSFADADVILTSYAILRRDKHLFTKMKFDYFILDESQYIKNPQSDISKTCFSIVSRHFLSLTGTPLENSMTDLWSQIHFINRNMLGSLSSYTKATKIPEKADLYSSLIKPFMLRRHKKDVLSELPAKTVIVEYCEMGEEHYDFYKELRNQYRDKFVENSDSGTKLNTIVLLEGLLRLRQAANHPVIVNGQYSGASGKFDSVSRKIIEIINQGSKILIFSSFVEHLKLYRQFLDEQNLNYSYLDGSTKDRQMQVEIFQNNDECKIFLLSLKAGGTGLNLTAAEYVFLLDPWWNPAAEAQAFDRAHRIGQKNKVFIYKFIAHKSIEEKILQLQNEKNQLFDRMIDNEPDLLKGLDIEKVLNLLE